MDTTTPRTPDRVATGRWAALAVVALAQLLTALDATIVTIALPSAQVDLGFTDAERPWVITAYTTAFAGLLLIGGRLGDRFGRRRTFLGGLAGFAVASALAGAAPSFEVLVVGRALQGASAAVLAPTALSLVAVLFTDRSQRGKAFAVYGAVASSGAIVGLLAGGALTEYAGWRWCLYVGVVVALVALVAGARLLPAFSSHGGPRIPLGSALLATTGLAALVQGASRAAAHGWSDPGVLATLTGGLLGLAAFAAVQVRSRVPMLPPALVAGRARLAAYLSVATAVLGSFGLSLMLTYYFQAVLGWSPLQTGLAFLPLSVGVAASGYLVAGVLAERLPPRTLVAGGLAAAAVALAALGTLSPGSDHLVTVLLAELLLGAGMGFVFTPCIQTVTGDVPPRDAGIAAAVANTAMQVGSSLGVAVLNTIAVSATASYGGTDGRAALVHGYATASWYLAAALALVGVVAARWLPPHVRQIGE